MVELLVAMAIMGLLMIMAFPTMRAVQTNNEKKKYESYGESVISAAKLYVDSYSNDLFDPSFKNEFKLIELSEIKKKGLLKDINISDSSCINGQSNITVVKYNNDYSYCLNLICTDKNNNEVYKTDNKKGNCAKFTKATVTYKYGDYTKNYVVVDGEDAYKILSPSQVGFDEYLKNNQYQFEKWDKGDVGDVITINGDTTINLIGHKYKYKIKYDKSNNSITDSTGDTDCTCGEDCILSNNGFKYIGYTFEKWHRNSNNIEYNQGDNVKETIGESITSDNEIVTLTTKFRVNKVYIQLNSNGAPLKTNHGSGISIKNNLLYSNNNPIIHTIPYNGTIGSSGLANYNNSTFINLQKADFYHIKDSEEWNTKSDGSGKSFDHDVNTYKASDFCNVSNGDCTITLYANWKKNTITLKYYSNGGHLIPGKIQKCPTAAGCKKKQCIWPDLDSCTGKKSGLVLKTSGVTTFDGDAWEEEGLRDHQLEDSATLYMTKDNHTATNYWCAGDNNCNIKINEDRKFKLAKNLAKAAGMLDDLKENNITIKLYAGWN